MNSIQNRYDFVYLFDVTNGNPNLNFESKRESTCCFSE